ncbi:MAG: hypothetical protein M3Y87_16300 [Myxococcota bacterium]|nr:hypothetical protein [Myxococcota bacterium]
MRANRSLGMICVGMLSLGALACESPDEDEARRRGGPAPDPSGVIGGTVLYVGPRPACTRAEDGTATEVIGRVVLTLFAFDNPPPPSGSASSALSLLTIPAEEMFSLADCMPAVPTDEDRRPVMRSAAFTWPEISLGQRECTDPNPDNPHCPGQDYQIRGFYDYDGDFNPFFGVRNLPTAGDVGGGAFVSTAVNPPQPLRIPFGHIDEQPQGQLVDSVAVTLGAVITTERPVFEVGPMTRAMASDARLPTGTDAVAREQALADLTNMRLGAIVSQAMPEPSADWLEAFAAAGIDSSNYRFGNPRYGFYIKPVDANLDMMGDAHPILGTAGINWFTPIIITRRARSIVEQQLGVPDVLMIGTIRPTVVAGIPSGIPRQTMMSFDALMAPVGVMVTNPAFPAECRAPIIPPGNSEETYERIWVDCQELPTGNYDVNVLSGIAGGTIVDQQMVCISECLAAGRTMVQCDAQCGFTVPATTENGFVINGGNYSSQAWSIPNELGCPDFDYRINAVNQLDPVSADGVTYPACGAEDSVLLPRQGRQGGWAIIDNAENPPEQATMSTVDGHGIEGCRTATRAADGTTQPVEFRPLDNPVCCSERLDQFCGLPLCPLRGPSDIYPGAVVEGLTGSRQTRELRIAGEDYFVDDEGVITPLCTPFFMPVECCRIAETCAADPAACPR